MTTQQATSTSTSTSTLLAASEIKGTTVTNLQHQDIGDVYELLIDRADGAVRFAVLSVGGFLGIGTTHVAVPWQAFDITAQGDGTVTMKLDTTRERLEKAPRIEGKNYERLYTSAGAEPVFVYWEIDYID